MSNEHIDSDELYDGAQRHSDPPVEIGRATPMRTVALLRTVEGGEHKIVRVEVGGLIEVGGKLLQLTTHGATHEGDYYAEQVDSLFDQDTDEHLHCVNCGATTEDHDDLIDADQHDSFGGTVEGHERCTQCGITRGWADLSAVI